MTSRPYRSWPSVVLRLFSEAGSSTAWLELVTRATEEANAVADETADRTGPWRVGPVGGWR